MPIKIEYRPEKELDAILKKILASEADCKRYSDYATILICFVSRTDEKEGNIVAGKVYAVIKKISPELRLFVEPEAQYIVVVDEGWWLDADARDRQGTISRQLSRIRIKVTDGGVKFSLADYDIKENIATLKAHGAYSQELRSKLEGVPGMFALMEAGKPKSPAKPPETPAAAKAPAKAPAEAPKEKAKEPPKKTPEKVKPETDNGESSETETEEALRPPRRVREDRVLPEPVAAEEAEEEVPEPESPQESQYEND